jgi:hypothetical protein
MANALEQRVPRSREVVVSAESKEELWREYNIHMLQTLFTTEEYADEYRASVIEIRTVTDRYIVPGLRSIGVRLIQNIASQRGCLISIRKQLDLIEEDARLDSTAARLLENDLVKLAERLDLVARRLLRGHNDRETIADDEDDAQDFLHALLRFFYEPGFHTWAPSSHAGGASCGPPPPTYRRRR